MDPWCVSSGPLGGGAEMKWEEQEVHWAWGVRGGQCLWKTKAEEAEVSRKSFQEQQRSDTKEREGGREQKWAQKASECYKPENVFGNLMGSSRAKTALWRVLSCSVQRITREDWPHIKHWEHSWGPAAGGGCLTTSSFLQGDSWCTTPRLPPDHVYYKSKPWC